jgi:DNA-binding MarR family transcriptional regulator
MKHEATDTPSRAELDEFLFDFLEAVYRFESVERRLFGLSWREVYLMQILRRRPSLSMGAAAEALLLPLFTLTRVVDRLEKAGFVARERVAADGRAKNLSLTEKGEAAVLRVEDYNEEALRSRLGSIERAEFVRLAETIGRFRNFWGGN